MTLEEKHRRSGTSPSWRFGLSPSGIARFFYHDCPRHLRYTATPRAERKGQGIPEAEGDGSPVTRALLERGYAWEEEVIARLGRGARVAPGRGEVHQRAFGVAESLREMARLGPGEAVYQPTLAVPGEFLRAHALDPSLVAFPDCRPDLVRRPEGEGALREVIDLKASRQLKTSHRIQVALYAMILAAHRPDPGVSLEQGGVWLPGRDAPEEFDLRPPVGIVARFLRDDLPAVLTAPLAEVPWHLQFRCEWCPWYAPCREEAERIRSVSLLPYLSVGARRHLAEADPPVATLEEFQAALERPGADAWLAGCGSLAGRRGRLQRAVLALREGRTLVHDGSAPEMPRGEHVRLVLTLQADPASGRIYAAGFRRAKGKEVYGEGVRETVHVAGTEEECAGVAAAFLRDLHRELAAVDGWNRARPAWGDQRSLQTYVYDGYEAALFTQVLLEGLRDPDLATAALALLFFYQDAALAESPEHPSREIPFPLVTVTAAIGRMLSLPLPLGLRLPEVLDLLQPPGAEFRIVPGDLFWFRLSNVMRSDAIYQAWSGRHPEAAEWVGREILTRLRGTHAVIEGFRERVKDRLWAWPGRFFFPGADRFRHPEFSRIAFITRYESALAALERRAARARPAPEREEDGTSVRVRSVGEGRWRVESAVDAAALERDGFWDYLLAPEGEEGEREQMAWDDLARRGSAAPPEGGTLGLARVARVAQVTPEGLASLLHLETRMPAGRRPWQPGEGAVLHRRHTDWTSGKVLRQLKALDAGEAGRDLVSLIRAPALFAAAAAQEGGFAAEASTLADGAGFTPSQRGAFRRILENRLTLVWGPPGTGKTYFLARAILCLAAASRGRGRPLRVAVAAFTHAAVENLLAEVRTLAPETGLQGDLHLCKLEKVTSPRGEGLACVLGEGLGELDHRGLLAVGATVYAFQRARGTGLGPADLLVVDEASQMRFGELGLVLPSLRPGGRLVLAGDDLQLPPIVKGSYPPGEDGLPGLHDSLFARLRATAPVGAVHQLEENWRMNATLSGFPADSLYGEGFRPATAAIAGHRLRLAPRPGGSPDPGEEGRLLDWLLDPDWPLVVGILEKVRAAAENPLEAALTSLLALELRRRLVLPGDDAPLPETAEGDRDFWLRGLFIVIPHHVQIRAVRRCLAEAREWRHPPFVDTVDTMQGQQCQAVIVGYGVADPETALAEAGFIYSRNRLNVATTRARAKCVVLLPRPLLEPSHDLLQVDEAAAGLGHMDALVRFAADHGQTARFDLPFLPGGAGKALTAHRAHLGSGLEMSVLPP